MSWIDCKIGDVFDVARGGSPRPIDKFITDEADGFNWIMIGDAAEGSKYIEKTKKKIVRAGLSKTRKVFPGDFLLTNSMSFGRPFITKTEGCIHDGWLVLSPREPKETHPDFFYHLLASPVFKAKFAKEAAGAVVKNLNTGLVKSMPIRVPATVTEQRRIAAILDKADDIRRKRRQSLILADEFLKSVFLDMFGDPVRNPFKIEQKPLGKCADFVSGATPSKGNPAFWNGVFPWVSPKDMKVDTIFDAQDHVSAIVFEQTSLKRIPAGTPLIVVRGMILAHTVPLAMAGVDVAINQDMKGILFEKEIDPVFGLWCLRVQHKHILDQVDSAAHGTKRLDMDKLKAIPIHVPGDNLQQKFVGIVEKFSEVRKLKQAAFNEAADMFSALSQSAFRGEL